MKMDVQKYDAIARTVFAPVYPVIAEQIKVRTGIVKGACIDVGCGGGYLGAALARVTDLSMCFFDRSEEMLAIVDRTIAENHLEGRATKLLGEVSSIGLPDASVDLAISRGSVFFWEDLAGAFREIHRVLAPGGWSYIGGGFGSLELKESIKREMETRDQNSGEFRERMRKNLGPETRARFEAALKDAGVGSYSFLQGEDVGLWILMRK